MRRLPLLVGIVALAAFGCGQSDTPSDATSATDRPTIVVTTSILGDVVGDLVGDRAEVVVIMEAGVDPHDFQPSAQQVAAMQDADALVVNGADFEEGLHDAIEATEADGVPTYEAIAAVTPLGDDPHFFTDPARMAVAAQGIADFLVEEVPALDDPAFTASTATVVDGLEALDDETEQALAAIPAERRVLITNHDVFGYFADRYGFEIVGVVIPGGSAQGSADAEALATLAGEIEARDLPVIFADTSAPTELAESLAGEVGDVEVVELYSEALGAPGSEADTYAGMVRTNVERMVAALR